MRSDNHTQITSQAVGEPHAFYSASGSPISISLIMTKTFFFMFLALSVSAITAFITYDTGTAEQYLSTHSPGISFLCLFLVELLLIFCSTYCIRNEHTAPAIVLFILYSIVTGLSLSVIFMYFELNSIVLIFGITSSVFGIMAIYGLITKSDLIDMGTIGIMMVIGVVVASIANFIFKSSMLDTLLSMIGLCAFVGLTAYDTQKIKKMAIYQPELESTSIAFYGAMNLYLDFINIFLYMLRLFARER